MKKLYFLIVIAFLFMINAALACSCIIPKPANEALNDASAVFSGTVESIHERVFFAPNYDESVEIRFDVSNIWKGNISEKVTVLTSRDSASCGYEFEVGKEYLVYTHGEDELKVSLCSRTAPLSEAHDDISQFEGTYEPIKSSKKFDISKFLNWLLVLFL